MSIIGINNVTQLCRICFTMKESDPHVKSEWETLSFFDMLEACFSVQVDQHECLPNTLCNTCMEELQNVYVFKLRFDKSNALWKDYLSNFEKNLIKASDYLLVNQEDDEVEMLDSSYVEVFKEPLEIKLEETEDINDNRSISVSSEAETHQDNLCKMEFDNPLHLIEPKKETLNCKQKTIKCIYCNALIGFQNYKQHLLKHPDRLNCNYCKKKFSSNFNLKRHMLIHMEERYICPICNETFRNKKRLYNHKLTHVDGESIWCKCCVTIFNNVEELKTHEARCDRGILELKCQNPYICKICSRNFKTESTLKMHWLIHTDKCQLCNECGKPFPTEQKLKLHEISKHGEKHIILKPFQCNICSKKYQTKYRLHLHIRTTHLGVRSFECNICKRKFAQYAILQIHLRTHTGEKPFICNICGRPFNNENNLGRHIKSHNNERPYVCDLCNKSYTVKHNLIVHKRTHTGEKPYACETCAMKFSDPSTLFKHRRLHLKYTI